ncbi:dynein light chain 1 cytoplasmic-like protein [Striga asiatica]|uniref:Dynein light chain n=1 Tax=Striga asiatica TaxID=4170 RepID=A0A5A7R7C5_STRAF|nr:dynein light chain 1 cytoplasmic-like protein [Striga asiatica]
MSEETKRSGAGAVVAPLMSSSDDRKSSSGSNPSKKVIVKSADMNEDMQKEAIDIAVAAFENFNVEKDVAEHIKKMFDKKYGPTWHCIVGKNFGIELRNLFLCDSRDKSLCLLLSGLKSNTPVQIWLSCYMR